MFLPRFSDLIRELRERNRVIEPLKDFHKDEVRRIGTDLGLPEELVQRHPFPGPGMSHFSMVCKPIVDEDDDEDENDDWTIVLIMVSD